MKPESLIYRLQEELVAEDCMMKFKLVVCSLVSWVNFEIYWPLLTVLSINSWDLINGGDLYIEGALPNHTVGALTGTYNCSPHRNLPEPSTIVSFSTPSKINQTAPSGRRRNRTPLQNLFKVNLVQSFSVNFWWKSSGYTFGNFLQDMIPVTEPHYVTNSLVRDSQESPTKSESFSKSQSATLSILIYHVTPFIRLPWH